MKTLLLAEIEDCRLLANDGLTKIAIHCPFLRRGETTNEQQFECDFPGAEREQSFHINSRMDINKMYRTFHKKCPLQKVTEHEETTDS